MDYLEKARAMMAASKAEAAATSEPVSKVEEELAVSFDGQLADDLP